MTFRIHLDILVNSSCSLGYSGYNSTYYIDILGVFNSDMPNINIYIDNCILGGGGIFFLENFFHPNFKYIFPVMFFTLNCLAFKYKK